MTHQTATELPAAIEMILPYVAGGGSDQRARLTAKYLGHHLNRPVTVVNRTGAVTGHTLIAQAAPDGATIGQITGEIGMMHWHQGVTPLTPHDYTALAESLPGFDMSGWMAVVAPTGTPQPVVARMHRDINALLADRDMAERILTIGPIAEPLATPDLVGALLRDERQKWGDATREIGLLPE